MNIEKIEFNNYSSSKVKQEDLLSSVMDQVFAIFLEDKSVSANVKISEVDEKIQALRVKVAKQDKLLAESEKLKSEMAHKLSEREDENVRLKGSLLESLGSSL